MSVLQMNSQEYFIVGGCAIVLTGCIYKFPGHFKPESAASRNSGYMCTWGSSTLRQGGGSPGSQQACKVSSMLWVAPSGGGKAGLGMKVPNVQSCVARQQPGIWPLPCYCHHIHFSVVYYSAKGLYCS